MAAIPRTPWNTADRAQGLLLFVLVVAAHFTVLLVLAPTSATAPGQRPPVVVEIIAPPLAREAPPTERPEAHSRASVLPREAPRAATPRARAGEAVVSSPKRHAGEATHRETTRASPAPPADPGSAARAEVPVRPAPSDPAQSAAPHAAPAGAAPPVPAAVAIAPPRFDAPHLRNPGAEYPRLARRLGEQGRVLLRVFVSAGGLAEKVEIESSSGSPRLDQAAREAVVRWRFVPARRGEEPVAAWLLVPVVFRLEG